MPRPIPRSKKAGRARVFKTRASAGPARPRLGSLIFGEFPVRRAKKADFGQIRALASILFKNPRLEWGGKNIYFVAFSPAGALAGFSHLILRPGGAILQGLGVSPSFRGRGVGKSLVSAACAHASKSGHSKVALKVKIENSGALGLYVKKGFTPSRIGRELVMLLRPNN
ncbi:MAG: GNAT family N-acetyltransferase [Candidatus Micrarchaeia archaeon]